MRIFWFLALITACFLGFTAQAGLQVRQGQFQSPVDGIKIGYRVYESDSSTQSSTPKRPLVISPGRAESSLRYEELANAYADGFDPIYVIDHRSQGSSDQVYNRNSRTRTTVRKFNDYVEDFLHFNTVVIKNDLQEKGITAQPHLLAHSMGSLIAGYALLQKPDIADKVVFIAPMFKLRLAPMRLLRGLITLDQVKTANIVSAGLCLVNCGHLWVENPDPAAERKAPARLQELYQAESEANERVQYIDLHWYREIQNALKNVMHLQNLQNRLLIIVASRDTVVNNDMTRAVACKLGEQCELVELSGRHPIHYESGETAQQLDQALRRFYFDYEQEIEQEEMQIHVSIQEAAQSCAEELTK